MYVCMYVCVWMIFVTFTHTITFNVKFFCLHRWSSCLNSSWSGILSCILFVYEFKLYTYLNNHTCIYVVYSILAIVVRCSITTTAASRLAKIWSTWTKSNDTRESERERERGRACVYLRYVPGPWWIYTRNMTGSLSSQLQCRPILAFVDWIVLTSLGH